MPYPKPASVGANNTPENYARVIDGVLSSVCRDALNARATAHSGSVRRDLIIRLIRSCGEAHTRMTEIRDETSGDYNDVLLALEQLLKGRGIEKSPANVNEALKAVYTAVAAFRDFGVANFPADQNGYLAVYKFDAGGLGETVSGTISPVPAAFTSALDALLGAFE